MAIMTNEKRYALEWIDEHARRFSDFHLGIWNYAEPAWREYKSARAYVDFLRAEALTSQRSLSPPGSQAASVPEQEPRRCGTKQDNTRSLAAK